MPFRTSGDHVRIRAVKPIFPEVTMSAPSSTPTPLQIGLVLFPRVTQLDFTGPLQVFSSLPGAKVHLIWKRIEPVTERFRAGADADHDVRGLPAARRHLRARRLRHRRHDQRRGDAGLPAPAGAGREIHHLGLHGFAGARRRRPAQRLSRGDALDGDGLPLGVRRDPDQDAGLRRPQPRHRRRRHRRDRFRADAGLAAARPADRGDDPAPARIQSRRRRSIPARRTPRRRKCSPS